MPNDAPVIIIRKKKGGDHGGHHGGAWKVAYADFVTAMMAFFLLLWLLNVTTDVERKGIADYFAPASVSKSMSGAGGIFGGQSITAPGAQVSQYSPIGMANVMPEPEAVKNPEGEEDPEAAMRMGEVEHGGADAEGAAGSKGAAGAVGVPESKDTEHLADLDEEERKKLEAAAVTKAAEDAKKSAEARAAQEKATFEAAESALRKTIEQVSDLKDLSENLQVEQTPEGLRIQIVDQDQYSMFPRGSAILLEKSQKLLQLVGAVISRLPNKLSISGHTDSVPFRNISSRDNWDLSVERANSSRRVLERAGVDPARFANVVGRADRDPLLPQDPEAPQNRRISIVLLRQAPVVDEDAAAPVPAAEASGTQASGPPGGPTALSPDAAPSAEAPSALPPELRGGE